jgi:anti-sigma B factor antagonist
MEIKQRTAGDGVIVGLSGEVDMSTSPDARRAFLDLVEKKTKKILVDLSQVTYIDSSGLATLVECFQNTRRYGGQLRLFGLNDNIKDVFSLARLDTIFDIRKSEEEALQ